MTSINHKEAQHLIQFSLDRQLAAKEKGLLESHLRGCAGCREYERLHSRLQTLSSSGSVPLAGPEIKPPLPSILRAATRTRRVRGVRRGLQYAALCAAAVFIGFVVLPAIGELVRTPNPAASSPAPGFPQKATTTPPRESPTSSPTAPLSPTPFAQFDFGTIIPWSQVQYFRRGQSDVVPAEAIRGDPAREGDLSLGEVRAMASFRIHVPYVLPEGYTFDHAWYDPTYDSVGICYVGPLDQMTLSPPRLCIREQPEPFQDFVGHSAEVHQTTLGDADAEYVHGGWIAISSTTPATRFQWDARMVPQTAMRFVQDGMYFEVFDIAMDCAEPVCPATLSLAEHMN